MSGELLLPAGHRSTTAVVVGLRPGLGGEADGGARRRSRARG
jgi:hypothetical protein